MTSEIRSTKNMWVAFIKSNLAPMSLILLQITGGIVLYIKHSSNVISTMVFFFATIFTLILILNLVAHIKTYEYVEVKKNKEEE